MGFQIVSEYYRSESILTNHKIEQQISDLRVLVEFLNEIISPLLLMTKADPTNHNQKLKVLTTFHGFYKQN